MKSILAYLLSIAIGMCLMSEVVSVNLHFTPVLSRKASELDVRQNLVAAILPGDPLITGTLGQGLSNGISLYSNVLFARIALSWFPQLFNQFPVLRPILIVTEPYLKVFRSVIPPIGGFDISAIPAFFLLDIMSNTVVAIGAEIDSVKKNPKVKKGIRTVNRIKPNLIVRR